jgi:hypothetical protein
MVLTDDLVQRSRAQAIGQRPRRLVFQTGSAEEIGQARTSIV